MLAQCLAGLWIITAFLPLAVMHPVPVPVPTFLASGEECAARSVSINFVVIVALVIYVDAIVTLLLEARELTVILVGPSGAARVAPAIVSSRERNLPACRVVAMAPKAELAHQLVPLPARVGVDVIVRLVVSSVGRHICACVPCLVPYRGSTHVVHALPAWLGQGTQGNERGLVLFHKRIQLMLREVGESCIRRRNDDPIFGYEGALWRYRSRMRSWESDEEGEQPQQHRKEAAVGGVSHDPKSLLGKSYRTMVRRKRLVESLEECVKKDKSLPSLRK